VNSLSGSWFYTAKCRLSPARGSEIWGSYSSTYSNHSLVSLVQVHRHFRGTYCLHLQGWMVCVASTRHQSLFSFILFVLDMALSTCFFPLKCQWTSTRLHGITSQKALLFTATTAGTSTLPNTSTSNTSPLWEMVNARQHSAVYISQYSDIHIQVIYIQATQNILTWEWSTVGWHSLSSDQNIWTPLPLSGTSSKPLSWCWRLSSSGNSLCDGWLHSGVIVKQWADRELISTAWMVQDEKRVTAL
jgi:hypothetical protein